MSKPKLSVLMPCRNAAATLETALDSIVGQTFEDFEVLAWDDGSEDATLQMLRRTATSDSRFNVVGHERVGLVPALQRLADCARGDFVARMDADDQCLPRRFERQIGFLASNPQVALCGCCYETFGHTGGSGRARYDDWMNQLISPDAIRRELFVECPVAHPTFFMRRGAFELVGGYKDLGWPEDYDLLMRLVLAGFELGKVGETLFRWRNHPLRTSLTDEKYGEAAFRALKRHYLGTFHASKMGGFYQWGAGKVGKRWLREWSAMRPRAVVDVNPRKIGTRIHGFDVIAPEALPRPGTAFIVVVVGAAGARAEIREWLDGRGHLEGTDYRFLA